MSNQTFEIRRVNFRFHDTPGTIGSGRIVVGNPPEELINDPGFDDNVFYYCATEEEYANLFEQDNNAEFYLIGEDD
jgi:hypothetical protein